MTPLHWHSIPSSVVGIIGRTGEWKTVVSGVDKRARGGRRSVNVFLRYNVDMEVRNLVGRFADISGSSGRWSSFGATWTNIVTTSHYAWLHLK